MFSRKERLEKHTPEDGIGRYDYLKQLVHEYKTTKFADAKQQVLANLANFAYDPINYEFLRSLSVIDIFLNELSEGNDTLKQYAIGGICNLSLDPQNKDYIIQIGGISIIAKCLSSTDEQTVLSAITSIMFLADLDSGSVVQLDEEIVNSMKLFQKSTNKRISNLATIFIQDYSNKNMPNK